MTRYKVISEFVHQGQRILAPGEWTAPNQQVADKMVAAGCLRRIAESVTNAASVQVPIQKPPQVKATEQQPATEHGATEKVDDSGGETGRGRRGHKRRDK